MGSNRNGLPGQRRSHPCCPELRRSRTAADAGFDDDYIHVPLGRFLAPIVYRVSGMPSCRFSTDFLWGAATSAHQVEGNNFGNDWWEAETSGRLPHRSLEACRHYDLFEQDFDLARKFGHSAHRFSIEWSRIQPEEGRWDPGALLHYQRVVGGLRDRGIEPIVTLHHFTNPLWLARRGGWARAETVHHFTRYVERVASSLDEVRYWVTINEPTIYAKHGYVYGDWPPFRKGDWLASFWVLRNMARAHVRAYEILHERQPNAQVGLAHSAPWIVPCDPGSTRDRLAVAIRDFLLNRAFFLLTSGWSGALSRHFDFLGLNYYARTVVKAGHAGVAAVWGEECFDDHHLDRWGYSDMGWEIHPPGLKGVLERFATLGLPLLITENGLATHDESLRRAFLKEHLVALGQAIESGVNVFGYLYWSLIDNFEWAHGREPRFGLVEVDYESQRRIPRPVADDFTAVCTTHRLDLTPEPTDRKAAPDRSMDERPA